MYHKHVRMAVAIAVTAITIAALAGCSTEKSASKTEALLPVEFYSVSDPIFGVPYYAIQAGLFTKAGVDPHINLFSSGTEATESFRSTGGGLVLTGDLPAIRTWLVGDTVGILPLTWDTTTMSLIVRSNIKSAKDLVGGKIATLVGASGSYYLHNYLSEAGIEGKVTIVNLNPGDLAPALARGDIDGFVWAKNTIKVALEATPGSHLLVDGSDGYLSNRIILSAAKSTIKNHPEAVQRAVNALVKACDQMANDPKAHQTLADYLKLPLSTVDETLSGVHIDCSFDQKFVDDMTKEGTVGHDIGLTAGPVNWSTMFDTSFLKKADPSLVTGVAK